MANYNTGTGFLDKYKEIYGSDYDSKVGIQKKPGMNDIQYETMSDLEKYYGMEQNRTNQHNNNLSLLDSVYGENGSLAKKFAAQKNQSQQTASTTLTQLEKYLPAQAQALGYGGIGASQSALLDAHNIYNNSMGNINSNYNNSIGNVQSQYLTGKSELENAYGNDMTNIKGESVDRSQSILDKYAAIDRQAKAETDRLARESQDNLYGTFIEKMQSGTFNTVAELENAYGFIKDKVREDQKISIENELSFYRGNLAQKESDEAYKNEIETNQKKQEETVSKNYNFEGREYNVNRDMGNVDLSQIKDWKTLESILDDNGTANNKKVKAFLSEYQSGKRYPDGTCLSFDKSGNDNSYVVIGGKLYPLKRIKK